MDDHDHAREVAFYGECVTCARRDGTEARAAAQEAIERANEHANPEWKEAARAAVLAIAPGVEFTTDDVWARLTGDEQTHERRALGAVMQQLAADGRIVKLDRVRPSTRPEAHANPKQVWRRAMT
jgi:hypothetical protein